ncbi:hypothetical protein [Nannocystis sp.]|uniref:hypothetical protein n=1 Tax=Nannocystis sp. TaxID=1962667 RepID=UPI0025CDBC2E|nr:hypothetical protein [Nannocystis sp.]
MQRIDAIVDGGIQDARHSLLGLSLPFDLAFKGVVADRTPARQVTPSRNKLSGQRHPP